MSRRREQGASTIFKRLYPRGVPQAGSVSEEHVKQIVRRVQKIMKEECAEPTPETAEVDEATLKFTHRF